MLFGWKRTHFYFPIWYFGKREFFSIEADDILFGHVFLCVGFSWQYRKFIKGEVLIGEEEKIKEYQKMLGV